MQVPNPKWLQELASRVAKECGFAHVPRIQVRRGAGGDWHPISKVIRIGAETVRARGDRLWYVIAHELAHAQQPDAHSMGFWRRLAEGLARAGRLELIRRDFGYREGALRVAKEFGLANLPSQQEFHFQIGDTITDKNQQQWNVVKRFRRAGSPRYRLERQEWRWHLSEQQVLEIAQGGSHSGAPRGEH